MNEGHDDEDDEDDEDITSNPFSQTISMRKWNLIMALTYRSMVTYLDLKICGVL